MVMSRERVYRQLTKERTDSVAAKSTLAGLVGVVKEHCEISWPEAQLLGSTLYEHYFSGKGHRTEGQIVYGARFRAAMMHRGERPLAEPVPIKLTIYGPYDVELWRETGGITALKIARLARWVDEARQQDALLAMYDLSLLTASTSKALRAMLKRLWLQDVLLPVKGMTKQWLSGRRLGWQERALERYLAGEDEDQIRREMFLSSSHWQAILRQAGSEVQEGEGPLHLVWQESEGSERRQLLATAKGSPDASLDSNEKLVQQLRGRFGLSPVGVELLLEKVESWLEPALAEQREPGRILYHAVSSEEPAGKPLSECELVPVQLEYLAREDSKDLATDSPGDLLWERVQRLSRQAYEQGGCLNQADLSLLLAVIPDRIQDRQKKEPEVFVPTRGNVIDIGPGVTHVRKIIQLYLQGYTETQIEQRTHHSLASIENYLERFCKVVGLCDDGLTATEIRMVLGCSMRTARAYVELVQEYDTKEHRWMMALTREKYRKAKKASSRERSDADLGRRKGSASPFASLQERKVEKIELVFLRRRLELAEQSLVGEKLLSSFNEAMDAFEQAQGIERTLPGQLLVDYKGHSLSLPLWDPAALEQLASQHSMREYLDRVALEQYALIKQKCPQADTRCLWSLLLQPTQTRLPKSKAPALDGIDRTEALSRLSLPSPDDVGVRVKSHGLPDAVTTPGPVKDKLLRELSNGLGLRDSLLEAAFDIMGGIRHWLRPPVDELKPGQVVWLAYTTDRRRSARNQAGGLPYRPVVLTHHTAAELPTEKTSSATLIQLELDRVARMTTEAWMQGAALTNLDLALLLHRSTGQVRTILDTYQQQHQVLLPTAGTVLDMGSTTTHKLLAVQMHLQQMSTTEISRRIFHTPGAIDNYLGTFNKVAMLHVFGCPQTTTAWLLSCSERLVAEHIKLANKHFPDTEQMRAHLEESGLPINAFSPCIRR